MNPALNIGVGCGAWLALLNVESMKAFILCLALYFACCFMLRLIRFRFFPRDEIYNTIAGNVGALIEYWVLTGTCTAVGFLG